ICIAQELTPTISELLSNYEKGLAHYRNQNFSEAIKFFQACLSDPASKVMLTRCQSLVDGIQIEGLDEKMIYKIDRK
ncbi:tetratricopeptide repeat protein, partial [Candidatus Peregrinibacteria bacterium]|nr:tetratricopeptide repeat protein [Candidatus Peregrinibacteria bacterium]